MTVSTDHTSGSSLESAAQNPVHQGFATPTYGESLESAQQGIDQCASISATSEQPPAQPAPAQPAAQRPGGSTVAPDSDAIEFRVIRVCAPVRRLRLTGNRYTFGSAEGCSIRLSDSALRPMHAVLIRDASRVLVRAYSVPIEINGTRTTEACLQIGDTLRLGAYQFELLMVSQTQASLQLDAGFPSDSFSSKSFSSGPRSIFDAPTGSFDPTRRTEPTQSKDSTGAASTSTFQTSHRELPPPEEVIWRERLRREVDQWRERQIECDRRENRCDERESDLRSRESELWSRAENLYRREARVQSQEASTFQLYDEFTQRQHELIKLREEAQSQQEEFNRREAEFRGQEFEYRRRLEDATRQLQQSHQQAETATLAVQRMREQFESLNIQIEELSGQQEQIETREQQQRDEHLRLRVELEAARDQAIDAQAESEARRSEAEARVAEMASQIESLKSGQGMDLKEHRARLEESERVARQLRDQVAELQESLAQTSEGHHVQLAESAQVAQQLRDQIAELQESEQVAQQLRDQIAELQESEHVAQQLRDQIAELEESVARTSEGHETQLEESERVAQQLRDQVAALQQSVAQASEESSRLRGDYEEACESVRQLESLVAQSNARGDQDRDSWAAEADELRSAVDQLSLELARANGELSELREANAAMSARLDDVQRERDDALQDVESRPTTEAFQSLREELRTANDQLSQMKKEYDETLARLGEVEAARDSQPPVETESDQDSWLPATALGEGTAAASLADLAIDEHQQTDDGVSAWPTSQSSSDDMDAPSPDADSVSTASESYDQRESTAREQESCWTNNGEVDSDVPQHTAAWEGASEGDVDRELASDVNNGETDSPWSLADAESVDAEFVGSESVDAEFVGSESVDAEPVGSESLDSVARSELEASATEGEPESSESVASVWGDVQHEDSPWPSNVSADDAADSDREPANPWQADSDGAWSEPESQPEVELRDDAASSFGSPWNQATESPDEAESPEMTSVWDEAGHEIDAQVEADSGEADVWSQGHEDANAEDPSQDDSSIVEGSLASMLIKDLESDSTEDDATSNGTYLMAEEPTSSWDAHAEQSGWDREYAEESLASEWSNDPEGFRVEQIDESASEVPASTDDSVDETQQAEEADFSTDYDSSAPQEEPQTEAQLEPRDADTRRDDDLEDEDSIEAYMNRLLSRGQAAVTDASQPETVSVSTSNSISKSRILSRSEPLQQGSIDPDAPLVPRSQAPERNGNLSAMRELANESARSAISRSVRIQNRDTQIKGVINFACAAGAAVCGIACLIWIPGIMGYLGFAMTAVVGVIYVIQGKQEFNEAKRRLEAAESGLIDPEKPVASESEPLAESKAELAETALDDA